MAHFETLRIGARKLAPKPITSKWNLWHLSAVQLLHNSYRVDGDSGSEVAELLKDQAMPESWNGLTFILPGSIHWKRTGLVWRRYVAAFKQVSGEWQLLYRTVTGGFGPKDYYLSVFPPPIR